jgi:hypothetical protein
LPDDDAGELLFDLLDRRAEAGDRTIMSVGVSHSLMFRDE